MNEATADNNGAYLSDGRHGNGCRQKEREGERGGERETTALRSVDVVLQFFLSKCFQPAFINAINRFIGACFIFNPAP